VQIQPLWTVVAKGSLSEDGQSDWFASFPIGTHFSAVHYVTYVFRSVCVCARVRARVCTCLCARVCKRGWQLYTLMHTCPHSRAFEGVWSVHFAHSPALYSGFGNGLAHQQVGMRRSIDRLHKRVCASHALQEDGIWQRSQRRCGICHLTCF
jgi:hypothetical protein